MDVYYFTYTGCSRRVAEWIAEATGGELKEIRCYRLPYAVWLLLSFFPLLEVPASFEAPSSDVAFLCFPKWTLNCPPVTYFLRRVHFKKLGLAICYGGFDERRYAEFYAAFAARRAEIVKVILIRRRELQRCEEIVKRWASTL